MATRTIITRALCAVSLAGALTFTMGTVGATRASAGTMVTPDVSSIANQVEHKLAMLPWYGIFDNLQFQVNGTEVTLQGQVVSQHAVTKDDAAKAAQSVPGVTKVVDNIEVLPPSPMDDQLRAAEYRAIFSRADLGRYTMGGRPQFHIIVKGGHVTLEGQVINEMDKNVAGIAAKTVPGVFSVDNNLTIAG